MCDVKNSADLGSPWLNSVILLDNIWVLKEFSNDVKKICDEFIKWRDDS